MTTKHKHHHSHGARVDLGLHEVRLGSRLYEWDDSNYLKDTKWYQYSTHSVKRNGKKVPFVAEKDRDDRDGDGDEIDWSEIRHRFRDSHVIRKLERAVERAEKRKQRHEKPKAPKLEDVLKMEDALAQIEQPEESASGDDSERKSASSARPKRSADKSVTRTKRGVQVFSNNNVHYFNVAVFKSRKYPGCASVRLVVAGKWYNYTLDSANMKALREEVARGGN